MGSAEMEGCICSILIFASFFSLSQSIHFITKSHHSLVPMLMLFFVFLFTTKLLLKWRLVGGIGWPYRPLHPSQTVIVLRRQLPPMFPWPMVPCPSIEFAVNGDANMKEIRQHRKVWRLLPRLSMNIFRKLKRYPTMSPLIGWYVVPAWISNSWRRYPWMIMVRGPMRKCPVFFVAPIFWLVRFFFFSFSRRC